MGRNSRGNRIVATCALFALLALATALGAEEKDKKTKPAAKIPPPPQRVAPRSADAIAYLFHGQYMNADGKKIAHPTPEAIKAFRDSKPRARAVENPRDYAAYCRDCVAAGVPEPPPFDSGKWVSKGAVADKFTSEDVKDILVYESAKPPGLCVALPRGDGADIQLLGVICQGKKTGKACFWDNVDASSAGADRIVASDIKTIDIAKFENADQLDEDCTDCHRGFNVYLIHDELENIGDHNPDKRYQPIPTGKSVARDGTVNFWSNPGRVRDDDPDQKNLMRKDGCGSCHQMPAMSQPYCSSVLSQAISKGVMPPGGLSESDRETLTCRDVCLLHYECVDNGATGVPDQAASDVCDCDNTWWEQLAKIPPKANPD
jgi:hypothetical protein